MHPYRCNRCAASFERDLRVFAKGVPGRFVERNAPTESIAPPKASGRAPPHRISPADGSRRRLSPAPNLPNPPIRPFRRFCLSRTLFGRRLRSATHRNRASINLRPFHYHAKTSGRRLFCSAFFQKRGLFLTEIRRNMPKYLQTIFYPGLLLGDRPRLQAPFSEPLCSISLARIQNISAASPNRRLRR